MRGSHAQFHLDHYREIIKEAGVCMLTTRGENGALHSRAMAPASKTAPFKFEFIANSESGKFGEVDAHQEVNVSFYDKSSTDWISVSGNAHASSDKARIKGACLFFWLQLYYV
jgi:general stress protein 26